MVFVVDDDPHIRGLVRRVAGQAGWEVAEASDGEQFLRALDTRSSVSLIFLDLNLPKLDGVVVLRELAARKVEPPIVLSSGSAAPALLAATSLGRSLGLEVVGSLPKPLDVNELRRILTSLQ